MHYKVLILGCFILNPVLFAQLINHVNFEGNSHFSDSELNNMIAMKQGAVYNENQIQLDINNILNNYNKSGFFESKIAGFVKDFNFDSSSVEISYTISEGEQVLIGEINISGARLFTKSFILSKMETQKGKIFDEDVLNTDITKILNIYETKGYTFASISIDNIEEINRKLNISIRIDENEKLKLDRIIIEGNITTNENVIIREITHQNGKIITKENLVDIKNKLENLGYFESVDMPKVLKYKNETVLQIKVKEGNTNTFDGILGYVPPAANETDGYITGNANISLKNLFGTGRKLDARYEKEVRTTQELELKYLEPWVFAYPINVNIGFLQRIEDTIYIKRTINTKTDVLVNQKFTVSALFFGEQVIPTASPQSAIVFNSRLLSTGIELKFDSRDYIYNPFKGVLLKSSYSAGQKKIYNSGDYPALNIPGDFTVQKASFELEVYSSFFKRQSALISLHGFEIRSPNFETSDFFRFGGTRSVRGYREGQFLGSRVVWNNNEVRYSLTRRSYAVALFDMGYYWRPADELALTPKQEGFIFGYGLGVRIETSLGIFGVSYALGRGDSILEGKVHFGIVNEF